VSVADQRLDPVLLAVLANRLDGICREMTNTLLRSGRSAVLSMARDFSCAIITADNEILSSAEGLPCHVIGMEFQTEAMQELHPDMEEGDAFLHNDPYLGNTHHADHAILVPVFWEGEHLFTAIAKSHQADCGNAVPTTYYPFPKDIYEEGALNFPCVKVQRDHRDIDDIIRMCRRRLRVPDQWYGDYLATVGSARIAERRLHEFCAKYGVETVKLFIREWFDYSERRMVEAIRKLPAGTLVGTGRHDPYPQLPEGVPLKVKVTIDPEQGQIELDLRDNPDNYPGGLNESRACATNNSMIGLFNSIDPDVPHNAGSFRRVKVLLREGCIAGIPKFPYSCSMATTNIADRLVSITQSAFADLGEGFGLAEGAMGMPPAIGVVSGHDSRTDGPYVNQIFIGAGGGPGGPVADGSPTYLVPVAAGLMYHDSVEVDEQKYAFHVYERSLLRDSGGAGRHRGGVGTRAVYGPKVDPMTVSYTVEAHENPPRGVRGGGPGAPGDAWKLDVDGNRVEVPMIAQIDLQPGERIVSTSAGGGGYGDPLGRAPAMVLDDVLEGWVSRERAERDCGVVLREADTLDGLEIDQDATAARRAELRG
jgi:N-methylhydantoinase B